jgi:hypothetical protein
LRFTDLGDESAHNRALATKTLVFYLAQQLHCILASRIPTFKQVRFIWVEEAGAMRATLRFWATG